ncbi:hypothetical protein BJY52DRAFT_1277570 [Lactarius psammicola]|nr:hypothetical protein BJY52DRAFT_1277570 [Lactarius psammicola]
MMIELPEAWLHNWWLSLFSLGLSSTGSCRSGRGRSESVWLVVAFLIWITSHCALIFDRLVKSVIILHLRWYIIALNTTTWVTKNGKNGENERYGPLSYRPSASIGLDVVGCVCCIRGARSSSSRALSFSIRLQVEHLNIVSVKLYAKSMQTPAQTSRHATRAMEQQTPIRSSDILNGARCETLQ